MFRLFLTLLFAGLAGGDGRVELLQGTEQQNVLARGWLTASNAHSRQVQQLPLAGQGVARVLDWANMREIESGALVPVLTDWEANDGPPVNLLYSASTRRIPRARAFIDFVTELFRDLDRARGLEAVAHEPPV